jgi:hypothetical protein
MAELFLPPQQLGIDLGQLLQLLLQLVVMLNAGLGRLSLGVGFEEKLVDLADGQALGEVIEGAVLVAAVVAMAVGFAAAGEPLDQRGAQGVGADFELGQQEALALAQGQGGFGSIVYPSHIYGEDNKTEPKVNKKESGVKMRKCSGLGKAGLECGFLKTHAKSLLAVQQDRTQISF